MNAPSSFSLTLGESKRAPRTAQLLNAVKDLVAVDSPADPWSDSSIRQDAVVLEYPHDHKAGWVVHRRWFVKEIYPVDMRWPGPSRRSCRDPLRPHVCLALFRDATVGRAGGRVFEGPSPPRPSSDLAVRTCWTGSRGARSPIPRHGLPLRQAVPEAPAMMAGRVAVACCAPSPSLPTLSTSPTAPGFLLWRGGVSRRAAKASSDPSSEQSSPVPHRHRSTSCSSNSMLAGVQRSRRPHSS